MTAKRRLVRWRGKVEREPICGFCWRHGIREPLRMNVETREWECPVCERKVIATKGQDELEAEIWGKSDEPSNPVAAISNPYPEVLGVGFQGFAKRRSSSDRTGRAKKRKPGKVSDGIGYLKE